MKNFFTSLLVFLLCHSLSVQAQTTKEPSPSLDFSDILGQWFLSGGGSSGGDYILITGVNALTRNTVEVSYIHHWMGWEESNVVMIDTKGENVEPSTFIINCKEKTYAPDSYATDGYKIREFNRGSAYKWGDYSGADFMVSADQDRMTDYMQNVCDFMNQF